jgi:hypothetical protein
MKIWLNDFFQNAAFPAIALAFACATINNGTPAFQASRLIDQRRMVKNPVSSFRFKAPEAERNAGAQISLQRGR